MAAAKPAPTPPPLPPPNSMGPIDSLFLLPMLVGVSALIVLVHLFLVPLVKKVARKFSKGRRDYAPLYDEDLEAPPPIIIMPSQGFWRDTVSHVKSIGKWIFGFEVVRAACLGALFGLSIYAAIVAEGMERDGQRQLDVFKKHKKKKGKGPASAPAQDWSQQEWAELGVTLFYMYTFLASLILLTVRASAKIRSHLKIHIQTLLLAAWILYCYRDIYPLGTYDKVPVDTLHAPAFLTWSRISLLTVSAVVLPLIAPRRYVPCDPANPEPEANAEQTTPLLSLIFYSFMDVIIWKAWKSPALAYDDIPPMTDYDRAAYLSKIHQYKMDNVERKRRGLKPRHLAVGIAHTFWKSYVVMTVMLIIKASTEFAGPVGVNRLLTYLQFGRGDSQIRPWVWILVLFLGPTVGTISFQWYIFTTTRMLVRAEAIFTQLIFDHALRIKMRDDVEADKPAPGLSGAATPAIVIEDTTDAINGHPEVEETNENSQTTVKTNGNGDAHSVKSSKSKKSKEEPAQPDKGPSKDLIGRINNLMGSDIDALVEGRDFLLVILYTPYQLILAVIFLYRILGWSSLAGMLCIVVTLPIPGYLTKFLGSVQGELMKASDARVAKITEAINALKMLKLFAWEEKIKEQLAEKREAELALARKKQLISLAMDSVNFILPTITMVVTYGLYATVQGGVLTPAIVFSSISIFDLIRDQLFMVTWQITTTVQAKVSLDRIHQFLSGTELLDHFEKDRQSSDVPSPSAKEGEISIKSSTFSWTGASIESAGRNFRLHIDDLTFLKGKLNIIAGPTGAGKSSLLMALLGEMVFEPSGPESSFTLPRSEGVAYAAQESWVMAGTVKENILFGTEYDEVRYKKVLHQCALEKDLEIFAAGDETELGEKGLNASGGQKARIALARAVYSHASIVLLDDVLSALDVHTSRWICDKCFAGDVLADRTVVLVTHHVAMIAPKASYIVHLGLNGTIESQGPVDDILAEDKELQKLIKVDEAEIKEEVKAEKAEGEVDDASDTKKESVPDGKLVQDEEKSEGRVSRKAMFMFFKSLGGPIFWLIFIAALLTSEGIQASSSWWLGIWAKAYGEVDDPSEVSVVYYLGLYVAIIGLQILTFNINQINFLYGSIRASRSIHLRLVNSVFASTLRFLDTTPIGRLIARFTKDIKMLDGSFQRMFLGVCEIGTTLTIRFGLIIVFVPIFTPLALFVAVLGGILGEFYIHGQLSVKREMSNAKSPLFSQMAAAISGIVSIRAYGAQNKVKNEARGRIDKYTRSATTFYNLNRWVTIRMDTLGAVFSSSLAALLVYRSAGLDPSTIGFAVTLGISASQYILWLVRIGNELEVQGNSVERIQQYLTIPHEAEFTEKGKPSAAWPMSGSIVLDKLSAKYSVDGPTVLDQLSLKIESGERVGIVGRTGSGKSTFTLALLRLIPTTGSIIIDGVDINSINLSALRSKISCIPQDPILLAGTLRQNLDPFGDVDDAELYEAMTKSGLSSARQSADGASTPMAITLETNIAAGGSSLSAGQRQLVALARALVRNAKVLVLDEATASVDFETDTLIQKSVRSLHDCTILTVAHRLSTIMDYDKIIVLGAGKLLEFDTPSNLLKKKDGYLRALVDDSGEVEALEKLAEKGSGSK